MADEVKDDDALLKEFFAEVSGVERDNEVVRYNFEVIPFKKSATYHPS